MARTLRSSATHSKSLLVFQMPTPQLRHFAKDLLQLVLPSEMLLHALRGCQVDDLKKAPPLKGLKSNFAHAVLRAVCRRAMTKMEGLSDFNSERFLRPSSRRSQTESYAMLMKLTFTAKRRALHVKACPFVPFSHPLPCLSLALQDGRWVKEAKMSAVCAR